MKESPPKPRVKVCSLCGQAKPFSEFHRRRVTDKSGYRSACKDCTSEQKKRYPKKVPTEEERLKARIRAQTQYAVE